MNYVLIFCNSTAGRLIYAHSHYNMCAGGGYMYQISNEKFGLFVTELRKEEGTIMEKCKVIAIANQKGGTGYEK